MEFALNCPRPGLMTPTETIDGRSFSLTILYIALAVAPELRSALTIGFCGAFTTMSTFSYESLALLAQGQYGRATIYMGATIIGCLTAVFAGMALAERLI